MKKPQQQKTTQIFTIDSLASRRLPCLIASFWSVHLRISLFRPIYSINKFIRKIYSSSSLTATSIAEATEVEGAIVAEEVSTAERVSVSFCLALSCHSHKSLFNVDLEVKSMSLHIRRCLFVLGSCLSSNMCFLIVSLFIGNCINNLVKEMKMWLRTK